MTFRHSEMRGVYCLKPGDENDHPACRLGNHGIRGPYAGFVSPNRVAVWRLDAGLFGGAGIGHGRKHLWRYLRAVLYILLAQGMMLILKLKQETVEGTSFELDILSLFDPAACPAACASLESGGAAYFRSDRRYYPSGRSY